MAHRQLIWEMLALQLEGAFRVGGGATEKSAGWLSEEKPNLPQGISSRGVCHSSSTPGTASRLVGAQRIRYPSTPRALLLITQRKHLHHQDRAREIMLLSPGFADSTMQLNRTRGSGGCRCLNHGVFIGETSKKELHLRLVDPKLKCLFFFFFF